MRTLTLILTSILVSLAHAADKSDENKSTKNDVEKEIKQGTKEAFIQRRLEDNANNDLEYSFFAHKPFYFLPYTYSFNPTKKATSTLSEVERVEVKFQFSFKLNLIDSFLDDKLRLSFAYTNLSFWQVYNKSDSRPFRETNHEPDLFLEYKPGGIHSFERSTYYRFGIVHQSNGQDIELSRSWNRYYAQVITEFDYLSASLMVWRRIPEEPKEDPNDSEGDDNPNITDYTGNFELRLSSQFKDVTVSTILRNNLKKDNKGSVEFSVSFPFTEKYKGYFQYYNGYAESLIDYDVSIQRVGLGIVMADWL